MARVIVFVCGREVTYVYGGRDFLVVYWENLFEGVCPECEEKLRSVLEIALAISTKLTQ